MMGEQRRAHILTHKPEAGHTEKGARLLKPQMPHPETHLSPNPSQTVSPAGDPVFKLMS